MVPVLAVTTTVVDGETIAVSGLSCYYSSAAATMVLSSAVTTADVTTTVADANLDSTQKRGVQKALLFLFLLFTC